MVHGLYRPWMRTPHPMVMNKTVIVNQQPHCHRSNGGFWGGFLGGFLGGGLFNSGLFGNIFGFGSGMTGMYGGGMMPGMMMPTMMPGATNNYAYLNQLSGNNPANQTNTDVTILQKHFPDYTISERDGKFIATDKDGNLIEGDSFDDMLAKLGGTTPATENPETQNMNEIKQAALRQGQLIEVKEEAEKFMKNEDVIASGAQISVIEDGENFAQYQLTLKDGTTKIVRDITSAYEELGISFNGNDETDAPEDTTVTPEDTPENPPSGNVTHQNSGSNKANGWERIFSSDRNETSGFGGNYQIDGKAQAYNANDIENAKSAQEVARYMLLTEMGLPAPTDASEDLINEIIQHNPSVFNKDGSVKENADWTKLDLPTAEYLKRKGYPINEKTSNGNKAEKPKATPMEIPINAYASTQPFK